VPRRRTPRIEPPVDASDLKDQSTLAAPAPADQSTPAAPLPTVVSQLPAAPALDIATSTRETLQQASPWLRKAGRWLLVLLALYAAGWLLWSALPALTPFIIGLVLAYLLLPIVDRLNRRMPRWLAILLVYIGGIGVIAGSVAYIIPPVVDQIQELFASIPPVDQLLGLWNNLVQEYRDIVPAALQRPIEQGLRSGLQTAQANFAGYLQSVGTFILTQVINILNTVTFLIGFLIIPIWLFYILNDQAQGWAFIDRLLPPRIRPDFWNIWDITDEVLSDYIRGQLILGLAVGTMVGAGLLLLRLIGFDVRYILLLAILAGVTELIPIIGPIIGAIPGVLLGFFASANGPQTGLAVLVVYIVVQQLENNLLVPRIIGESVGVHPAILTVILIAMGQVFGLLGIVLAAPLTAIVRDLFVYVYRRLDGFSAEAARRSISIEAPQREAAATPG
jgi:predicted PurR-regulated permease PerM